MGKFTNFSGSSLRKPNKWEDEDPTSGLTNLADCMLVFACGLMAALVVAWNIDLSVTEVSKKDNYVEVNNVLSNEDSIDSEGSSYIDMGRIYQDPETGKLYMIEGSQDSDSSSSSSSEGSK